MVVQSTTPPSRVVPSGLDKTRDPSTIQGESPSISRVVKTPLPAGITAPENENPRTTPVSPPV